MENIVVGFIVVAALVWAAAAAVRGLRRGRAPGSDCACSGNCPVAGDCPTDTPGAPGALCNEEPNAAATTKLHAAAKRP